MVSSPPICWKSVTGYRRVRICKGCGQKFIVTHRLQLHCSRCRADKGQGEGFAILPGQDSRSKSSRSHSRDAPAIPIYREANP